MKTTFNKVQKNKSFYIEFPSGKWIYYTKVDNNQAKIIASIDGTGIGYINPISAYQLVTVNF